jgi:hypothetical protein
MSHIIHDHTDKETILLTPEKHSFGTDDDENRGEWMTIHPMGMTIVEEKMILPLMYGTQF